MNIEQQVQFRDWLIDNMKLDSSVANIIVKHIDNYFPCPDWISCEDRLPEISGDYFVYETNHGVKAIEVMRFDRYNKSWYMDADCFHPTHWMPLPLPQPPKQ